VLWDLAAHDFSILEYLFPAAAQAVRVSELAAVHAEAQAVRPSEMAGGAGTAPSRAALSVHFPGALIAYIHVDWAAGEKQRRIEITGTKGSLVFDDLREPKLRRFGPPGKAEPSTIELEADEPLTRLARHFAACIRGAERTIDDACRVIRVLEAASRSLASSGSLVPLDAECRPYQPRAPKEAGLLCNDAKLDAR
jgi:predicted dehydrogenase